MAMNSQLGGIIVFLVGAGMLVLGLMWTHQAEVDEEEGNPGHKALNRNGIILAVLGLITGFLGVVFGTSDPSTPSGGGRCKACDHDNPKGPAYCNKCGRPMPPEVLEALE